MCGIAGFIETEQNNQILESMMKALSHRGPDGSGAIYSSFEKWTLSLGHRRLSIIDIEGGAQPFSDEDERYSISFNGEIYNFLELRKSLEQIGIRFRSRSDTEVLLKYFIQHGLEGLSHLDGMFSFAIWDKKNCQLTIARDRAGIKPLYYAPLPGGGFAFGSELKALFQHPQIKKEVDRTALTSYFFLDYVQAPLSMIRNVHKLAPGHFVQWQNGTLSNPRPFWTIDDLSPSLQNFSMAERAGQLLEHLRASVKDQLISDVPVGSLLSGGLDSSIVSVLASKEIAYPLQTFSIAFENKDFDESSYSQLLAKSIGSTHTEVKVSENDLFDSYNSALTTLDEPIADPSIIPTYILSQAAASKVKVALSGDGSDELFAGYPTYQAHRIAKWVNKVPTFLQKPFNDFIAALPVADRYQPLEWKLKRFFLRWDADPHFRHLRWMSNVDTNQLKNILTVDEGQSFLEETRRICEKVEDPLNSILALDFLTYLPGSVLPKVDRASMSQGLEVRPPFLCNKIIEWAFNLSSAHKLHRSETKYILKQSVRSLLPKEVVSRSKRGFGIPLSTWIKGSLRHVLEEILHESPVWTLDILQQQTFKNWFQEHLEGKQNHSKPLWALVVFDHWVRKNNIV